jgi:transposase-like protein
VYEEYHKCCLLRSTVQYVHHKNKRKWDNRPENLQLTTIYNHKALHRKDYGQICRCGSKNVNRNGFHNGKQIFQRNSCKRNWTVNNIIGIDFGQICLNCNSSHVIRNGGVENGKQGFQCKDCKRKWGVSLQDLREYSDENDRKYRAKVKSRMKIK